MDWTRNLCAASTMLVFASCAGEAQADYIACENKQLLPVAGNVTGKNSMIKAALPLITDFDSCRSGEVTKKMEFLVPAGSPIDDITIVFKDSPDLSQCPVVGGVGGAYFIAAKASNNMYSIAGAVSLIASAQIIKAGCLRLR